MRGTLEVHISHGQIAIIDAIDYKWINRYKWYAVWSERANTYYAQRYIGGRYASISKYKRMHIEVMQRHGVYEDGKDVHHLDHNGLHNTCTNLEMVTHSENGLMNRNSDYQSIYW